MWDLIVSDHCSSFYFDNLIISVFRQIMFKSYSKPLFFFTKDYMRLNLNLQDLVNKVG